MPRRTTLFLAMAGAALVAVPLQVSAASGEDHPTAPPTHVNSCWSTDNGAPVLDSFSTTTQSVDVTDGPATIGITVHAHDVGGPGPAHPLGTRLQLQVYEPDALDPNNTDVAKIALARTQQGTWTGSWTVPQNAPAAPIRFNWLLLKPSEGPVTSLPYDELGPDATIQVTSAHPGTTAAASAEPATAGPASTLRVRGSHPDHRKPRVHLSLSTHRLRLHPGGYLTVRVHASDSGSGVDAISLAGLGVPTPGMFVPHARVHPFHRISGTRHRGIWVSRIHVRCLSTPRTSRLRVIVRDRAGNETSTPRQAVRITGPDRVAPLGDDLSGGGTGRATVRFSEPVRGISTTSVVVSEHGRTPAIAGTWSVSPGRYVTSATFTATDPDAQIGHMDFAPDGHLDVLDRAGNPLLVESDAD